MSEGLSGLRRVLCAGTCLLLAVACGGGGSPPPAAAPQASEALLEGHAFLVSMHWCTAGLCPGATASSGRGLASFDGAGALALSIAQNTNGTQSVPFSRAGTYEVDADRAVRLTGGGSEIGRGVCGASGDLTVLAAGVPDDPVVFVTGRREGFFDGAGVLEGSWRVCAMSHDHDLDALGALYGDVVFDDAGTGNVVLATNLEGFVFAPSAALGTAFFAGDGSFLLDVGGGIDVEGGVVRGGDVALLAGGVVSGQNPTLFVLVRAGASATTSSLAGTWGVVGFERDTTTGDISSSTGRAVADAAGNLSLTLTVDEEGSILTPPASPATWSVAAGGGLTFTRASGDVLVGGVSPDGSFAAVSGGTTTGDDPALFVFVR